MTIFNHIVFFNIKVSLFSYLFNPVMFFLSCDWFVHYYLCGGIICLSHISQPFDASKRLLHWVTECSAYELDTFSLPWWQVPLWLTKRNKNKFLVWIILNGALCCKINNISNVNRSYGIRWGVQITHNNLSVRNRFIPHCEVRRQAQSSPLQIYWIIK